MTKKKKSHQQKRTLMGAVCVAVIIMAGSTFAWFTSSDEVTNRLSASANYGVSIAESFEPPANWIPGQEVNKDAYVMNTGNIPAFIKEELSGILTITTEVAVGSDKFNQADCVELATNERYAIESGAYLAWKPEGSAKELGNQVISIPDTETNTTDFEPDVNGLYVFRRKVGIDPDTRVESFEYAAYQYRNGKFYKASNLQVTVKDPTILTNEGNGGNANGQLSAASAGYYVESTEVVDVPLKYDEINNQLVAEHNTGVKKEINLNALAQAYDTAIGNYNAALDELNQAQAKSGNAATSLEDTKTAYDEAYKAYQDALTNRDNAYTAFNNAQAAYAVAAASKTTFENAVKESKTKLYGKENGSTTDYTEDSLYGKYHVAQTPAGATPTNAQQAALHEAQQNYETELIKLHGSINLNADATADSLEGKLATAESALSTAVTNQTNTKYTYNTKMVALYGNAEGGTDALTTTADGEANKYTANSAYGVYQSALEEYENAVAVNNTDSEAVIAAKKAFNKAIVAKTAAEKAYNEGKNGKSSDGILRININLANVVTQADGTNNKWQLLPAPIPENTNVATFYYTGILDAGKTSSKLIDSVQLDKNVTADMYKSFDFDLKVALKSVQIAYDTDDVTIVGTGASEELGATVTLSNDKDLHTALAWRADTTPAPAPEYILVTPVGTENPSTEGWYEKDGENYTLTEDTEVNSAKTYYAKQN